jgi:aminomethyltransferase
MGDDDLLKTALHEKHIAAEAKMTDEAGWKMPLSYGSVLDEARMVRTRAGIFDIGHLGRLRIRGDGALDLLERICTADVAHQEDNTAIRTLLCNERGGILDQAMLVRTMDFWVLTTSACNRAKVLEHLARHAVDFDVKIDDQTERTSHVAVAGPGAGGILDAALPVKPASMPRGAVKVGSLMIARYIAMRVGYTGEWSLEVILPHLAVAQAWRFITQKAGDRCIPRPGSAHATCCGSRPACRATDTN